MTKEITKASILQAIANKFGLREFEPSPFLFSETVHPIYDIGEHLKRAELKTQIQSITGTGTKTFFEVPQNERWHLHGYNVIFMTGAYTIAGVMLTLPLGTDWFYLDMTAAISASYAVNLPKDTVLYPGEDINVNVDGYTSTGNLELRVSVTVEEIR